MGELPLFSLLIRRRGRFAFLKKETTYDVMHACGTQPHARRSRRTRLSHDAAIDACRSGRAWWIWSKIRRDPGRACPVLGLGQQRSAPCMAQARGLLSMY